MSLDLAGYDLVPELLQRAPRYLDILVRNRPDHSAVRLAVAASVEDLYGNATGSGVPGVPANRRWLPEMLPGRRTATSSAWPVANVLAQEPTQKYSRIFLGLQDLDPPILDGEQVYLAVQQVRSAGPAVTAAATPILGPILVVPSPSTLSLVNPTVTIQCQAPGNTKGKAGSSPSSVLDPSQASAPPPLVLAFWLQQYGVTIRNLGPDPLLYAFGWGDPYVELGPNDVADVASTVKFVFLAGSGSKAVKVALVSSGFKYSEY